MKLREIQTVLRDAGPGLTIRLAAVTRPDNSSGTQLSGLHHLRDALGRLQTLPPLGPLSALVTALRQHRLLQDGRDMVVGDPNESAALESAVKDLAIQVKVLLAALNAVLPAVDPARISIRLPDSKTPEDLAGILDLVGRAFDRPLARLNYRPLEVVGVDCGSMWIELAAGASAASGVLYAARHLVRLFGEAAEALSRLRTQNELLHQIKADAELRKRQSDLAEETMVILYRNLAERFAANPTDEKDVKPVSPPDHELVSTTIEAFKALAELGVKGAEVRMALAAGKPEGTGAAAPPSQLPSGPPPVR